MSNQASAKKTILIVEDEPDIRELLKDHLDSEFDVYEAGDGYAALEQIQKHGPDVVLSDVRMPEFDGIQFLKAIRARGYDVPFVFFSGFSDISELRAFHLGACAMFKKPFNLAEITNYVKMVCEKGPRQKRRIYPRIQYRLEIRIISRLETLYDCVTINLSEGGMFVGFPEEKLPGIGENVKFAFPKQPHIENAIAGEGICRWAKEKETFTGPRGFGLEFAEIDDEQRLAIRELVNRLFIKEFPHEDEPSAF